MYLHECSRGSVVHLVEDQKRFGHVVGLNVKDEVPFIVVEMADNPGVKESYEPRKLISGVRAFNSMPTSKRV